MAVVSLAVLPASLCFVSVALHCGVCVCIDGYTALSQCPPGPCQSVCLHIMFTWLPFFCLFSVPGDQGGTQNGPKEAPRWKDKGLGSLLFDCIGICGGQTGS